MSDWQVGDLALCVDGPSCGCCCGNGVHPLDGQTVTVTAVFSHFSGATGLNFASGGTDWCACQFRKILPDKHEECEPEFVTLLQRIKRKQTVPASAMSASGQGPQGLEAKPASATIE